jgi:hypothetical protein
LHGEPGGHPPICLVPKSAWRFHLPRARETARLAHPICQLNRRVSLPPRTPSSRRAVYGLSKHYMRCSPVRCSTESGALQQPLRIPLFVSTTPTKLVPIRLKRSGGTGRCALEPSPADSRSSASIPPRRQGDLPSPPSEVGRAELQLEPRCQRRPSAHSRAPSRFHSQLRTIRSASYRGVCKHLLQPSPIAFALRVGPDQRLPYLRIVV